MSNLARQFGLAGLRLVLWGIVVPLAVPLVFAAMILVAARWLIYCLVGVLAMVWALGTKEYAHVFWLAFFLPFFLGGLIDALAARVIERQASSAAAG
jgi:hypothetical protein